MAPRKKKTKHSTVKPEDTFDRNLPSFVDRLPFETLSHCLKLAEWSYRDEHGARILVPWTCAYQFCRVSRFWQVVAMKTPELWSCMTIRSGQSFKRAVAWAARTKKCPLDIKIFVNGWKYARAMEAFEQHVDHVENLSIIVENYHNRPLLWFRCMTGIRRLHIYYPCFKSVVQVLDLLRSCPIVEILSVFARNIQDHTVPPVVEPVELPNLRIVAMCYCREVALLLPHLRMPAVEVVDLAERSSRKASFEQLDADYRSGGHLYKVNNLEPVYNFLRISLYDGNLTQAELFFQFKCIEVLELYHFADFPAIITVLSTPNAEGHFLLPRLRNLVLRDHATGNVRTEMLTAFKARFEGVEHKRCTLPVQLNALVLSSEIPLTPETRVFFQGYGTWIGRIENGIFREHICWDWD